MLTINGQDLYRHFYVEEGATVEIADLTLTNGFIDDDAGAAVYNEGNIVLRNCRVTKSVATPASSNDFAMPGAALYNEGTMSIFGCSITENRTQGYFVGGGGIYNAGELIVDSSVIVDNVVTAVMHYSVNARGGGIYNKGTATVLRSTISENSTLAGIYGYGGGVYNFVGNLRIDSSLIDNNRSLLMVPRVVASRTAMFSMGRAVMSPSSTATSRAIS